MKFTPLPLATTLLLLLPSLVAASDWLQFGFDPSHSGNNTAETSINAANVHTLEKVYSVSIFSEGITAAPVYLGRVPTPTGTKDVLFATSYDGYILAIDASNGSILWSRQPTPVPYTYGIASTASSPALDPNRQFVYSYGLDGKVHKYAVGDGAEVVSSPWPAVSTLKPDIEHGAAALAIGTPTGGPNYLYAVTNGYNGDNGDYQGHVTTINLTTGSSRVFNANCSNLAVHLIENGTVEINDCATPRSGIWGRPGAVYDAGTNRMYVTTANGNYNANLGGYNWGDSVLALAPSGGADVLGNPLDSYTPTNYAALDLYDIDLGSGALAILPTPATSKFRHLGVVMGKDSVVRLLNLDNMSGSHGPRFVGGELQALTSGGIYDSATPQAVVWVNTHGDGSTWIYEAPAGKLMALQLAIDSMGMPSLALRWSAITNNFTSSSIMANDVLYAFGSSLQAFDPTSGSILWSSPSNIQCCGWGAPILVNGRLYMVGGNTLTVFALDSIFMNGFD